MPQQFMLMIGVALMLSAACTLTDQQGDSDERIMPPAPLLKVMKRRKKRRSTGGARSSVLERKMPDIQKMRRKLKEAQERNKKAAPKEHKVIDRLVGEALNPILRECRRKSRKMGHDDFLDVLQWLEKTLAMAHNISHKALLEYLEVKVAAHGMKVIKGSMTARGFGKLLEMQVGDPRVVKEVKTKAQLDLEKEVREIGMLNPLPLVSKMAMFFGLSAAASELNKTGVRTIAKARCRIRSESFASVLVYGSVQIGKTLLGMVISTLSSMVGISGNNNITVVVYLSDKITENHNQSMGDYGVLSRRLRRDPSVSFVTLSTPQEDHSPANKELSAKRVLEIKQEIADAKENGVPTTIVVSCKKNFDNMEPLFERVLKVISEDIEDGFDIVVINDEADSSTAKSKPTEVNKTLGILNQIVNLPQAVALFNTTATPYAIQVVDPNEFPRITPSDVVLMPRPESYLSAADVLLSPEGRANHVEPFTIKEDERPPFTNHGTEADNQVLSKHRESMLKFMEKVVLHHVIISFLMLKDKLLDFADNLTLMQLTMYNKVQKHLTEILSEAKANIADQLSKASTTVVPNGIKKELLKCARKIGEIGNNGGSKVTFSVADYKMLAALVKDIDIILYNGDKNEIQRKIPKGKDVDNPINAIVIALRKAERAKRFPGLNTTIVMHQPKSPKNDSVVQSLGRGFGHVKSRSRYLSFWFTEEYLKVVTDIAIAEEKTREGHKFYDENCLDLRRATDLSDILHSGPGGITGRIGDATRDGNKSPFTNQRYDKAACEAEDIADIVARLEKYLISNEQTGELTQASTIQPSKTRSVIIEAEASTAAGILLKLFKPINASKRSDLSQISRAIEDASVKVNFVIAMNGLGQEVTIPWDVTDNKRRPRVAALKFESDGTARGSLSTGGGEGAIHDWHTDLQDIESALHFSNRRRIGQPVVVLLKIVQATSWKDFTGEDDMQRDGDAAGQGRLMFAIEGPQMAEFGSGVAMWSRPVLKDTGGEEE